MFLKSVIVIGGGLAGLAAGVALAESGWRVRLFEQRPFLGGRATSYVLPDGEHVDNCQHVTLGCCTNLEDFYTRIGAAGKIKFFDRLLFLDPQGRRGEMHAGFSPAPCSIFCAPRVSRRTYRKTAASPCSNGSAAAAKRNAPSNVSGVLSSSALSTRNLIAPTRALASTFSGKPSSPIAPAIAWECPPSRSPIFTTDASRKSSAAAGKWFCAHRYAA